MANHGFNDSDGNLINHVKYLYNKVDKISKDKWLAYTSNCVVDIIILKESISPKSWKNNKPDQKGSNSIREYFKNYYHW